MEVCELGGRSKLLPHKSMRPTCWRDVLVIRLDIPRCCDQSLRRFIATHSSISIIAPALVLYLRIDEDVKVAPGTGEHSGPSMLD